MMPESPNTTDAPNKRAASSVVVLKQRVHEHFQKLMQSGCDPNEAAVQALALARAELAGEATASQKEEFPTVSSPPAASTSLTPPTWHIEKTANCSKYGPLCLGLMGPFQSICVVGEPRLHKKLLILDIDHTIYDPSEYGGSKGSTVKSNNSGFYDESTVARCRPGLHEFLTEVYKLYDIMVWSASDMLRILTLLQQLGMLDAGHSDYKLLAVLDRDSMSEFSGSSKAEDGDAKMDLVDGALAQTVTVPEGAIPGQLIEARSIADGSAIFVSIPPGLKPGDTFPVTIPGAISSIVGECDIDVSELQLALQMSMGPSADSGCEAIEGNAAPIQNSRRRLRNVKPLSLIWACCEFSPLYSEKNTVIVDDAVDVCGANPHNSIQCARYYWRDHDTDSELPRLGRYLASIANLPSFPESHKCWRDGL